MLDPAFKEVLVRAIIDIYKTAKEIVEAGGQQPTLVFKIMRDDMYFADVSAKSQKDLATFIRKTQEDDDCGGTILAFEGWYVEAKDDESLKDFIDSDIRPSESPDRKKGLLFIAETRRGSLHAKAEIHRNPDHVGELQIVDNSEYDDIISPFVGGYRRQKLQ